jgi:hypothetical protein
MGLVLTTKTVNCEKVFTPVDRRGHIRRHLFDQLMFSASLIHQRTLMTTIIFSLAIAVPGIVIMEIKIARFQKRSFNAIKDRVNYLFDQANL